MKRKPDLTLIKENDNCVILYLNEQLNTNSLYERTKGIIKFCDRTLKIMIEAIDMQIINMLSLYGITLKNKNEKTIKRALDDLMIFHNKKIQSTDLYECVDEEKVLNVYGMTIIVDEDNMIQTAVKIEVVDL
jgi:hypothetical protein